MPNIYLVYLMNAKGDHALYCYDSANQLLLPYELLLINESPLPTESDEPEPTLTPMPTQLASSRNQPNPWTLATAIMGLICLLLIGLLIWQGSRRHVDDMDPDDQHIPPPPPIKRV